MEDPILWNILVERKTEYIYISILRFGIYTRDRANSGGGREHVHVSGSIKRRVQCHRWLVTRYRSDEYPSDTGFLYDYGEPRLWNGT